MKTLLRCSAYLTCRHTCVHKHLHNINQHDLGVIDYIKFACHLNPGKVCIEVSISDEEYALLRVAGQIEEN